jgi:hypothetical protein
MKSEKIKSEMICPRFAARICRIITVIYPNFKKLNNFGDYFSMCN